MMSFLTLQSQDEGEDVFCVHDWKTEKSDLSIKLKKKKCTHKI